jgi:hypothetical protein
MPRVLEETTTQEIDRSHIVRRVDDWVTRVERLYGQIESWLPSGWSARRRGTAQMHEELMQRFDVPLRNLPILELLHDGQSAGHIEPRGLWIIGANGRLDFFRGTDHFVIVDTAENFEQPDWQIAPFTDRRKAQPLNRDTLITAL